jgi:Reverse transcriptase (RNA-dependent DNA polymerase)
MRRFVLGWKMLGLEQSLGSRIVTYADDLVILCRKGRADEALQQLRKIMSKLKLTVNEEKTRICRVPEGELNFLGHSFGRCIRRRPERDLRACLCATQLALGSLSPFWVGFSPCISQRTRKRGPGSERDWRLVQFSRYRASIELFRCADTAPMSFSALSTCSRSTATTCDSGCSRSASECWRTYCAGGATVSPSMRSVSASKSPQSSGVQPTASSSAASKLSNSGHR